MTISIASLLLILCLTSSAFAQTAEQRTIRAFEAAKKNPLELRVFLEGIPKGGDLHLHLSGGTVSSETLIHDAAQDQTLRVYRNHDLIPAAGRLW